jgi:hypothetical protein
MNSLFSLDNGDLQRLIPEFAVQRFRDLLWAECGRLGLPTTRAEISSRVDASDGGVDATITRDGIDPKSDLIQNGLTAFQIKAGSSFAPWQLSVIRNELFGDKAASREHLGPSVRRALDQNGRYVLVCFGVDPTESQRSDALKHMTTLLACCGYSPANVALWGQNKLLGLFQAFPSLVGAIREIDIGRLQTHCSWALNADMQKAMERPPEHDSRCDALRTTLRMFDRARHVRVVGDAGCGKTRFVLEALRSEDLSHLVLYADSPQSCEPLLGMLCRVDNGFYVILVVDECDQAQSGLLWNRLQNRGPRIKLVTIYNQPDSSPATIEIVDPPALRPEEIKAILRSYVGPHTDVDRWATLAEASPRFAHLIGENLRSFPEDPLRGTEDMFSRIIAGSDSPSSENVRRRRCVVRHLALFSRFGFIQPVEAEGRAIAELVQQSDNLSDAQFRECVRWLKDRRLLQGTHTLYITPKALHIHMWCEYWNTYGDGFDFDGFVRKLQHNPEALGWFFEMFRYAARSKAASRVVRRLLEPQGQYLSSDLLRTEVGARFFLALTEADPAQALRCLQSTVGRWTRAELNSFSTGRQWVVWALERIAIWREHFCGAARVLLALGEAENATNSNNASGVFVGLFSLGPGRIAPTEAHPSDRIIVLREAFESDKPERRLLAIRACRAAFRTQGLWRSVGAEHQGLKAEPHLWTPQTYGEWAEAIRNVWILLVEQLDLLTAPERSEAIGVLLSSVAELTYFTEHTAAMVADTFERLADKSFIDRKALLRIALELLGRLQSAVPQNIRTRWEELRARLIGTGFSAELHRFVGLSVYQDEFDEDGNRISVLDDKLSELAEAVLRDPTLIAAEVDWLTSKEADNAYRFGHALGIRDTSWSLLSRFTEAQRRANLDRTTALLGGYLRAMFETSQSKWEAVLDAIASDEELCSMLPQLVWRSGMTEFAARRILGCAERGSVAAEELRTFALGRQLDAIPDAVFDDWVALLLRQESDQSAFIALLLCARRYVRQEREHSMQAALIYRLLTHDAFFVPSSELRADSHMKHQWSELAQAYVSRFPEQELALSRRIVSCIHETGSVVGWGGISALDVLDDVFQRRPDEGWALVTQHITFPMNRRSYEIQSWLRGFDGGGAIRHFRRERIWAWIDEDVERRARFIADVVPKVLRDDQGYIGLARALLVRYGARQDVQRSLYAHWMSGVWTGSEVAHHQAETTAFQSALQSETDPNVIRWLDGVITSLELQIEGAAIREEREL